MLVFPFRLVFSPPLSSPYIPYPIFDSHSHVRVLPYFLIIFWTRWYICVLCSLVSSNSHLLAPSTYLSDFLTCSCAPRPFVLGCSLSLYQYHSTASWESPYIYFVFLVYFVIIIVLMCSLWVEGVTTGITQSCKVGNASPFLRQQVMHYGLVVNELPTKGVMHHWHITKGVVHHWLRVGHITLCITSSIALVFFYKIILKLVS